MEVVDGSKLSGIAHISENRNCSPLKADVNELGLRYICKEAYYLDDMIEKHLWSFMVP